MMTARLSCAALAEKSPRLRQAAAADANFVTPFGELHVNG